MDDARATLLKWLEPQGGSVEDYSTRSLRRTKASIIYRATESVIPDQFTLPTGQREFVHIAQPARPRRTAPTMPPKHLIAGEQR